MSRRNDDLLNQLLSAARGGNFQLPDELQIKDNLPTPATTIDEQVARGLVEIESLSEQVANPASLQFGKNLLTFLAEQSKQLGLSGQQFGNIFGYAAELHQAVDVRIRENLPSDGEALS
jgi:hypothetical protein